jgi:hypothetical protein
MTSIMTCHETGIASQRERENLHKMKVYLSGVIGGTRGRVPPAAFLFSDVCLNPGNTVR